MAYVKKTTNVSKRTEKDVVKDTVDSAADNTVNDTADDIVSINKEDEYKPKEFDAEDLIPCRSMVSGQLFVEGIRSKLLYIWADYNDICDVQYNDLIYMVRSYKDKTIYEPRIIVEDEEFLRQNPKLKEFYDSLYTEGDLFEIINLPTYQMTECINKLPIGCKEALKGIVSTMIDSGSLDSVQKIKALDEIFGTNMLLTLVQE